MLDFYSLKSDELSPEYPDESRYIGGISLIEFKQLSEIIEFCDRKSIDFNYFSDFKLVEADLRLLSSFINDFLERKEIISKEKKEVYQKLIFFISKAINGGVEIFCFSD